jgi:hypothetical protein
LFDGTNYKTIDFPGATETTASGINSSGQIVGYYVDGSNVTHGFTLINSVYATLDFPGAAGTYLNQIIDNGQIVGNYWSLLSSFDLRSFLATPVSGNSEALPSWTFSGRKGL